MASPTKHIKAKLTGRDVEFGGEYIDLKSICDSSNIDYSHLSHIFSATSPKMPSHTVGRLLAEELGMTYPDFIEALDEKKSAKTA